MIADFPGWSSADRAGFEEWARGFGKAVESRLGQNRNNTFDWRVAAGMATAAYTDDGALFEKCVAHWKQAIEEQINEQGLLPEELRRTNSLGYSSYAMNALTQGAELARQHGIDLYHYRAVNGRTLKLALDTYAPYVALAKKWDSQQIAPYTGGNAACYELAYSVWKDPTYYAVIVKWKRPMYEERVLGNVTLTHGDRFALAPTK